LELRLIIFIDQLNPHELFLRIQGKKKPEGVVNYKGGMKKYETQHPQEGGI